MIEMIEALLSYWYIPRLIAGNIILCLIVIIWALHQKNKFLKEDN